MSTVCLRFTALLLLFVAVSTQAQTRQSMLPDQDRPASKDNGNKAAEDISGMYSFLGEGEFVQINLEPDGVSGYISRRGDLDSDRGVFLDQFFSKASVNGHDVSFTTKPLHGVWYEFQGRFDRGQGKTKADDGYYVIKGTLKQYITEANKNTSSRSRTVEFKLLAQPPETGKDRD
jgi:hypothetical protein